MVLRRVLVVGEFRLEELELGEGRQDAWTGENWRLEGF